MAGRSAIKLFLLLLATGVQLGSAQTQNSAALRQSVADAGGRVIVMLRSTVHGAAIRAPGSPPIAPDEMTAIEGKFRTAYSMQVATHVDMIGAVVGTVSDVDLARLAADTNVASIEPDVKTSLLASSSPTTVRPARVKSDAIPWGITDVGAPAAWAAGVNGSGVKVGIIDTGIDYTHPDLVVVGGYDFNTSSSAPSAYNDNVGSCDGHGTHVAGTVAARQNGTGVVGVAPAASLYALKVFFDNGGGCVAFMSSQILAIQWAATNHLDVVNLSIGNSASPSWASTIAAANAAGVVVVAAAGNSGAPGITYPAAAAGAVAVAALNGDNTVAGFSSSGPEMWVGAPGYGITSTIPGGGYGDKSGTSMAAPHVTGVVALIRQAHPSWTADQVRNELKNDAVDLSPGGFDNATGWGLVQAPPTGVVAVTVATSPGARSVSVTQGNSAPGDNATITLSGTNASGTGWSATKKKSWLTLTTSSGTGSGTVAWTRNATGLAVGTYVDTITVSAASSSAIVYDTLKITAPVVPVTVALNPAARSVSVTQGNSAPSDNATVTLSGTNAGSTGWSATKKKAWLTFTTANGTGNGTVAWTRNATGLAVGTYVDTITVTAASSNAVVYDTLKITAVVVPVTVAVAPGARSVAVTQGNSAPGDNATVTLSGTNAGSTGWSATKTKAWLTLTTSSGTGSGTVAWTRNASGLAVGTYVDTITVTAASSNAVVYDTLKITAVVVPVTVTVAVAPGARSVAVTQGNSAPGDNATVTLSGTNAGSTGWSATKTKAWLTLTTSSGTGSGTVAWTRNASGLTAGTYVDTITVSAASSSAVVYDTLKVNAVIVPVTVATNPAARIVSVVQGSSAPGDNAAVTLTGTNASSTAWLATKTKPWLTFTAASGTGSGTVAWTRNASGLAVGTYVDTIKVSAASSSATIVDTLRITAVVVPVTVAVAPGGRSVSVTQGAGAPADNAAITLSGTNAGTTTWTATKTKSWLTLTTSAGTGNGTVAWSRNANGLAVGTYVDTITVVAASASAVLYDTLKVNAVVVPVTVAVSPAARSVSVTQGSAAPGDNAAVTLSGTNAGSTGWSATKKTAWLTLSTSSGTGNGTVSWTRNASGLAAGLYVDTITVTAATSSAVVYDTLKVNAVIVPVTVAVSPAGRSTSVTQGNPAPGDNAAVTLSGTNAAGTAWTASKSKAWLTLTSSNGVGNGSLTWSRNTNGLAAGIYVDTITVIAASSVATVYDTLKVTAPIVPVTIAISPASRNVTVEQGSAAPGDNALVTLSGTNAGSATWSATRSSSWATLSGANGTGSRAINWSRNTASLGAGSYVDTITVTLASSGQAVRLLDSLTVTPVAPSLSVAPHGKKGRAVGFNGSGKSLVVPSVDSAVVQGIAIDNLGAAGWVATASSPNLVVVTAAGAMDGFVKWSRPGASLAPGMYVDTVSISLVSDPSIRTQYVDSLEVVSVTVPVPDAAVGDLFDRRSLSDDQRTALDRQGNNNGRYDLGDFLAWVNRNHIHLSASTALRLKQLPATPVGGQQ